MGRADVRLWHTRYVCHPFSAKQNNKHKKLYTCRQMYVMTIRAVISTTKPGITGKWEVKSERQITGHCFVALPFKTQLKSRSCIL